MLSYNWKMILQNRFLLSQTKWMRLKGGLAIEQESNKEWVARDLTSKKMILGHIPAKVSKVPTSIIPETLILFPTLKMF